MDNKFPIKGRYIVALWIIPYIYLPGLDLVYSLIDESSEWFWYDLSYYFYFHTIFTVMIASLFVFHRIDWSQMFAPANRNDYPGAIKLTAFIFIFSEAAAFALFYPLSFVVPEFVNYWFIDLPPVIYSSQNSFPVLPNLLSFISLVVLAPIIEEFAFRGILLHRWSGKWGMNRAILFSSVLFGAAHPDPIGAFAFGVAMSALYLRTQTLIIPIICHALNNFVVWLFNAGYIAAMGANYRYTLEEFQSDWVIGLVCGLISILWAYIYINRHNSSRVWSLPEIQKTDHHKAS